MESNKTVKFNVGGVHYETSRSLIEGYPKTMIARLISDTWKTDPDATVFIDCNGDRFQYTIEYMRYKKVHLPRNVSKVSFLRDMEYYGFQDIRSSEVNDGLGNLEAAQKLASSQTQYLHDVARLVKKKIYMQVSYACFLEHVKRGCGEVLTFDLDVCFQNLPGALTLESKKQVNAAFTDLDRELLDETLAVYGFTFVSYRHYDAKEWYPDITLALLGDTDPSV